MRFPTSRRMAGGLLLSAAALLAACSDEAATPAAPPLSADQELVQRIVDLGFRRDLIVDEGDHFRVEGDVIIRKADLAGPARSRVAAPGGPLHQWHTTGLVSQANMARGLRVNLSGISGNSAWTTAVRNAMASYTGGASGYNNKISISEGSPADITFSFGTLPSGVVAQASFPANGLPGTTITISTAYANSLSSSQKQWVMAHEIGHTIGYRHSNWQSIGETSSPYGAVQIPGTPTSDLGSVMRGAPSSIPSWNGFNSNDQATNRHVYPAPAATVTSTGYDGAGHPTFSWTTVANASSYQIWYGYWVEMYDPYDNRTYWQQQWALLATTSATSYTDTYVTYAPGSDCSASYEIWPTYPSGKTANASGAHAGSYEAC
jgi:Dual-action HEIGH metallo-peptidase